MNYHASIDNWAEECIECVISMDMNEWFKQEILEEEIKATIFNLGAMQALGLDGYSSYFLKRDQGKVFVGISILRKKNCKEETRNLTTKKYFVKVLYISYVLFLTNITGVFITRETSKFGKILIMILYLNIKFSKRKI